MNDNITKDWALYESGKQYNNRLEPNYYDTVDANIAFFNGDQWRNLSVENMPKPVVNILKRALSYFVASLTSSRTKINYEPMLHSIDETKFKITDTLDASDIADLQVENLFSQFKMDFKIKEALFDAGITGDACAHFYFDMSKRPYGGSYSDIEGDIGMELVDGTNIFFGNANNNNPQVQPYIIISGRDMVKNLKDEASNFAQSNQNAMNDIESDDDYFYEAGDASQIEVEADQYGKALYIIVYRKKRVTKKVKDAQGNVVEKQVDTIVASKSVRNSYIYQDVDTGLSLYPISWLNWEKQKNQYHGRALATGLLPNQIFINRMFAMVMYHLMMTAFPKAVYNKDVLTAWDNTIGSAIGIQGLGPDANIKNVAGYLEPGIMSGQITEVIDMIMNYTKESLGINDALMGNVNPTNTSAIIALQKSASVPLENPKSNLYEWIEDIGKILIDMMGTYYGNRPIVVEENGQKQIIEFDFSLFKSLWMDVKVDVGEASYWSEISSIQTLDNLLQSGQLDFIEYLKRIPDSYIPQKQDLINTLEERMQQAQQSQQPTQPNDPQTLISQLSPQEQQAFQSAPPQVQQQIIAQLQQQSQQAQPAQQAPPNAQQQAPPMAKQPTG